MAGYAVNDVVVARIRGQETTGKLVDINIEKKQFEVLTEHGRFWVDWDQIRPA